MASDGLLESVCKAGVLALSTAQTSVDANAVEREFDRLRQNIERSLEERVAELQAVFERAFDDETGTLPRALWDWLDEGGQLAEFFPTVIYCRVSRRGRARAKNSATTVTR